VTPGGTGGEGVLDLFSAAEADEGPEDLTVTELNRAVRRVIEGAFGGPVWVRGEVGNWKRAASGHCYFSLKDESSEVRCVMWRNQADRLPMDPDDGMEVRLHADATLYEARGSYQLKVRRLEAAGEEGLWRLAFERLRKQLQEEGLLAPVPDAVRLPPGHPEGFIEAFANVYVGASRAIRARDGGGDGDGDGGTDHPAAPAGDTPHGLLDHPTVEDGARGIRFIHAAVRSSREGGWVNARYERPEPGSG